MATTTKRQLRGNSYLHSVSSGESGEWCAQVRCCRAGPKNWRDRRTSCASPPSGEPPPPPFGVPSLPPCGEGVCASATSAPLLRPLEGVWSPFLVVGGVTVLPFEGLAPWPFEGVAGDWSASIWRAAKRSSAISAARRHSSSALRTSPDTAATCVPPPT
eukprot:1193596-Prorocentrum_minimum.AAC.3